MGVRSCTFSSHLTSTRVWERNLSRRRAGGTSASAWRFWGIYYLSK